MRVRWEIWAQERISTDLDNGIPILGIRLGIKFIAKLIDVPLQFNPTKTRVTKMLTKEMRKYHHEYPPIQMIIDKMYKTELNRS